MAALHFAACNGHADVVEYLLSQGAQIEMEDDRRWRPLHFATANGHDAVVEALVWRGADTEAGDMFGKIPLERARDAQSAGESIVRGARKRKLLQIVRLLMLLRLRNLPCDDERFRRIMSLPSHILSKIFEHVSGGPAWMADVRRL